MKPTSWVRTGAALFVGVCMAPSSWGQDLTPPDYDPAEWGLDAQTSSGAALGAGEYETAAAEYSVRVDRDPSDGAAWRGLCLAELGMNAVESALEHCREALARDDSAASWAALGIALLAQGRYREALPPIDRALAKDPSLRPGHRISCWFGVMTRNDRRLRGCTRRLIQLEPESAWGQLAAALVAVGQEDTESAREHLEIAKERGIADSLALETEAIITSIEEDVGLHLLALLEWPLMFLVPWLLGLVVLFLAGLLLSRWTLTRVEAETNSDRGPLRHDFRILGRLYSVVIQIALVYFFVSLPFVVLLTIVATWFLCVGLVMLGPVVAPFTILVLGGAVAMIWPILKGLRAAFSFQSRHISADRVDLQRHSRLRTLLGEVAERVGTRPVDTVFLVPDSMIAVEERGRTLPSTNERTERCLVLGLAALDGLSLGALAAILAHEYGHFFNRDTVNGGVALSSRRIFQEVATAMVESEATQPYNPIWLFVLGFGWAFLRISQGASRLQEIRADQAAVRAFGSGNAERALRQLVRRGVEFEAQVQAAVHDVYEKHVAVRNVYAHRLALDEGQVEEAVQAEIDRRPHPFDSHPSCVDRIRWGRSLNVPDDPTFDGETAWSLFDDREAIEQRMTVVLSRGLNTDYGINLVEPGREGSRFDLSAFDARS